MGMFDHVIIDDSIPLPCECEKRPKGLQTKNLANELTTYEVTKFGRLVNQWNKTDQNYHGSLSIIGSFGKKLSDNIVELDMHFQDGFLLWTQMITRNQYDEIPEYSGKVKFDILLWRKLWRIVCVAGWELKMIFFPPERDISYIIPEKSEAIFF